MLESASPVLSLDAQEIQSRGMTRVEDLLITLPQVYSTNFGHSSVANGAAGTASADLRYLGAQRTVVLVDGRRLPAGDAQSESFVAGDLNFIPSFLVKRVDVLTGGASSVYGGDAVAGVVNFILDRDFVGVKGGVNWGGYQHSNGNTIARSINAARGFTVPQGSVLNRGPANFNVALGANFDQRRGHATVYLDYRDTPAITKDQRDYTNCSVQNLGATGPACGGSSTWQGGRFIVSRKPGTTGASRADFVIDPSTGVFRPRQGTDVFNFAPYNFMQRPDTLWRGGGFMNYQWNRYAEGYADVMFMDDYTDAQIAPSGNFANTTLLNCDNPMLTSQQRQAICTDMGYGPTDIASVIIQRRNVEGGGRVAQLRHTGLRFSFGMRGDINDSWRYDAFGQQGEMHSPQRYANDLHVDRLQNALIVDGDPNNPATWRCRSADTGCVPWNIFRPGGVTKEALEYLTLPLILDSGTRTRGVQAQVIGDLGRYGLRLPGTSQGVRLAIGAGYRQEFMFSEPDLAYRLGLGAGQGGATVPVKGDYDTKELFTEAVVPLVQGRRGAQDLSLELGYRYSDYSSTGGAPTYKTSASWAPVSAVRIRTGYNRATVSPSVLALFFPQSIGLGGSEDLCAGDRPTATPEQCERQGVPRSAYGTILENPAGQYNTLEGGNPNLQQEIANTVTAGFVVTPQAFPGFSATLDYYRIRVDDTIGSLEADDIMKQCVATGTPVLCGLIKRDRFGTLWLQSDGFITTTNQNVGKLESQGLDVSATYARSIRGGALTTTVAGTYLTNQKTDTGLFAYDCVGFHGNQCGIPTPRWRHAVRVAWDTTFNTTLAVGWRFIGGTKNDDLSDNEALGSPANVQTLQVNFADKIEAFNYLDVSANYRIRRNYSIVAGINNILDKEPPLGAGLSDNDFGPGLYGTYDHLGRYLFTGIQFQF
jgi:outer membrane receptor protein involved in Fe transport